MSASFLLCIGVLLFYLKFRKNIMQQQYQMKVAEMNHQKDLLHAIIRSQEDERKRIGMDLHDEIGASLSAIKLMLQLQKNVSNDLDHVIHSVRNISHNLFPVIVGEYGFSDALHEYCSKLNQITFQVRISFQDDESETFLQKENALIVYRIVIELINNTLKHAKAKEISILFYINAAKEFMIDYKDDGIGFTINESIAKKGMGLKNIESRLGILKASMSIEKVTKGSFIKISIPT